MEGGAGLSNLKLSLYNFPRSSIHIKVFNQNGLFSVWGHFRMSIDATVFRINNPAQEIDFFRFRGLMESVQLTFYK